MADIRLSLQVDSTGAVKSIKTFNDEVEKTPGVANKAGDALKSMASSFASGIGIGAGIETFRRALGSMESLAFGAARALGAYSDQIVTLGQRTGLTVSSLQVLNAMAKTSGTDIGSLSSAVVKMEVALNKGDDSFKKLGLSLSELKAMAPDAAFAKVADSIGKIEDPMQRAAAAVAVFGKSGAEMLPVFASNMAEAKKQAEEFGLVLSDKTMAAAEALGDAIDTTGMAFQAMLMRIVGLIAESPAVMGFFNGLSSMLGSLAPQIESNRSAFEDFAKSGVGYAVDALQLLIKGADIAVGALDSLVVIGKAIQIAFLAAGRAVLELARAFTYFGPLSGFRAEIDARIAAAKYIQDELRKEQDLIKKNREERSKYLADLAAGVNGLRTAAPGSIGGGSNGRGGGGAFDGSKVEMKVQELKIPSFPGMWMDLFGNGSQGKFGTLQGGSKNYNLWGDPSKFLPPELAGNVHVGGSSGTFAKATHDAAQALQNFANLAALSTSKLGKALAQVFGSGAGLASGIGAFNDAKKFLGKLGAVGSIASAGIGIVSGIVGLFKKKPKEVAATAAPASASAASWASFTGDQQSKGAAGVLAGVSGIKVTSAADMSAQASIASQSFWAMFKEQGLIKAADAFKAVRDKMLETFKAAGASDESVGAMLGGISSMVDLAGNDAFRGAADGANGFSQALASIANQQLPMTLSQFRAYEQQAVAGFEQMKQAALDQGLSMQDALVAAAQGSGQFLTTLQDAAKKYGFDLSGGTQGLLDQANAAGVSFGTSSQDRLIMSLDALTETLGGAPPRFEQAITNAGGAVGARIGQGNTGVNGGKELNADGIGESTADALTPGLEATAKAIVQGISAAFAALPTPNIVLDSGALAGAVAGAINSGYTGVTTALDGH